MKHIFTAAALLVSPLLAESLTIIPQPAKAEKTNGSFELHDALAIRYKSELKKEAELLAAGIENATGIKPKLVDSKLRIALQNYIALTVEPNNEAEEAYSLKVTPKGVVINGSDAAGAFYGAQSLLQLIPLDGAKTIPGCDIQDQPRFGWRGMHLDVGRHMFDVKDIKKFIDWLAFHKMNSFHWHLTEDQGWRIEIKQYPKLTEIGGYRKSSPPYLDRWGSDGKRYGGFYTQEEIKEVVAYAMERHINVVPEIDMPGHMAAAITAYPELGNDDIPNYKPQVYTVWGVHPYVLAPKEETFKFIDNVLTEVCELFPSKYIHIGGDEAPKGQWKQSKFAQEVMKREGCKDEHDLQSYFIGRLDEMLTKKGRKIIGWDEIREGGLSKNATMMLWRGWGHAVKSIEEGHDVVMAPGSHTYFDHYQNLPAIELSKGPEFECIGGYRPIESVYTFNPVPEQFRGTAKAKHVLGCQGQLWSEYMHTWDKVEYCAFPRIAALAEVAWSPQESRNYEDFLTRLKPTLARYKKAGINHFDPFNPGTIETRGDAVVKTDIPSSGNIPEFAVDGKPDTFFWSQRGPKKGETFTVALKEDVKGDITVKTGGVSDHYQDTVHNGVLEVSTDGKNFKKVATFEKGVATAKAPKGTKFFRIKITKDQGNWLIIQDIQF